MFMYILYKLHGVTRYCVDCWVLYTSFPPGGDTRFGAETQEDSSRDGQKPGVVRADGQDGGSTTQGRRKECHNLIFLIGRLL